MENDTKVSAEDLFRLKEMYEVAHLGKLEDTVSGWGGATDRFYWSNSPLYTLLRRVFLFNPMLGPDPFPRPKTLGEVGAYMDKWHFPLLKRDICQEDPDKSKAEAIQAATCEKEYLPVLLAVDEGHRDSAPLPAEVAAELFDTLITGGAVPTWYKDTGKTPDAWILAMWRMERDL